MKTYIDKGILKNIHSGRGEIYAFLCRAFGGVPGGIYGTLSQISPKLETIAANTDNKDIVKGAEGIIKFLEIKKSLSGTELEDFETETLRNYTAIFCLPKSVPTDESIYVSYEHRERMEPYDKMKTLFRKYNIQKTNKISENEDFISYELILMSRLAYDCADFIETGDEASYKSYLEEQYAFHKEHFDKWLAGFCGRVINFGIEDEKLYVYLAHFARGFVAEDKAVLKDLLAE